MSLFDFIFGKKRSPKRQKKSVRSRSLQMESLEQRELLAVYTVDSLSDDYSVNYDSGYGSYYYRDADIRKYEKHDDTFTTFRMALYKARQSKEDDTINIAVTGTIQLRNYLEHKGIDYSSVYDTTIDSGSLVINGNNIVLVTSSSSSNDSYPLFLKKSTVTITNMTISGDPNAGYRHCPIEISDGSYIFNNVAIKNVNSDYALLASNSSLALNGCTISNNAATGLHCIGSNVNINDTVISNNTAGWSAGGISANESATAKCTLTISRSIIAGNRHTAVGNNVGSGGIFLNNSTAVNIYNSIIAGNYSDYGSGGIYQCGRTLNVVNTTIAGNYGTYAGGVYTASYGGVETFSLKNSIISKNIETDSILNFTGGNNLIGGDPKFTTFTTYTASAWTSALWKNWNFKLQAGSPAVDAGNNAYAVGTLDYAGATRIQGTKIDIGAYEYAVALGVPQVKATGVAGGVKLTWTAIAGADRYFAWRRNATNTAWIELGTVTGTTLTDTAARVGVAETYAIRAYQGTKESSYIAVKGTALAVALGVPQVKATGVAGGVKLTWTAIAGADKYVAWRRNATNTAWIELGTVTGTTLTDSAARVGVAETYAVRAYQGTKESSYVAVKGTALAVTLSVPPVVATGQTGGVKLSWTTIAGADRYVAWRRNATNTAWIELGSVTGTAFFDPDARPGVAETYAVRAFRGTQQSGYVTVKGTATFGVPQVVATGRTGGVQLSWNTISGADRYCVWRRSADGKSWIELGSVTGAAFFDPDARVGVAETYGVRAFRGAEKSDYIAVKGTAK